MKILGKELFTCHNEPRGHAGLEGWQRNDCAWVEFVKNGTKRHARVYLPTRLPTEQAKNHEDYLTCSIASLHRHFRPVTA